MDVTEGPRTCPQTTVYLVAGRDTTSLTAACQRLPAGDTAMSVYPLALRGPGPEVEGLAVVG